MKPPDFARRTAIVAVALIGAATILGSRATAETKKNRTMTNNDNYSYGRTDEHDLSVTDTELPPRVRALIQIGDEGIARENDAAVRAFFHTDFRFHGPGGTELDREQLWAYFANCRAAFDGFSVTRQAVVTDGAEKIRAKTRRSACSRTVTSRRSISSKNEGLVLYEACIRGRCHGHGR